MNILLSFVVAVSAIVSSSWDKWMGSQLVFSMPFLAVYFKHLDMNDEKRFIFAIVYTLFYFANRYDIGFMAILFFVLYFLCDLFLSKFKHNFWTALLYFSMLSFYLNFLSFSFFSFFTGIILISILYFLNLRLITHGR